MSDTPTPPANSPKNNKTIIIIVVAVLLLAAGSFVMRSIRNKTSTLLGEKAAEKIIEKATGGEADVDVNSGKVTVKTNEGTFSTGTELPKDWPKDVPVYTGSTVTYSGSSTPKDGKTGFSVMLTTKDTIKKVSDYYTQELKSQGWTIESTQNITTTIIISAVKDSRDLVVSINSSDESTAITLVTSVSP